MLDPKFYYLKIKAFSGLFDSVCCTRSTLWLSAVLTVIVCLQPLSARASVTDSLESVLVEQLEQGETEVLIETYYLLVNEAYRTEDYQKSIMYSEAALRLSPPPVRAHFFQSQRYFAFANTVPLEKELHFLLLDTAIHHSYLAEDDAYTYRIRNHHALDYKRVRRYKESISAFERLKDDILAKAPNLHQEQLLSVHFELASLYAHLNDVERGIEAFRSGMDISVQLPPSYTSSQLYMMGSYLMSSRATIEETHRLELIAERHAQAIGHHSMLAFIYSSRAEYFRKKEGMRDSTLLYLSKASKLHAELKDTTELILVFFQLANISKEDGMIEKALFQLEMVRDFCADQSGIGYCQSLNFNLAELFFDLPRLDSARFFAEKALEEAQLRMHPVNKARSNQLLAAISEREGDFQAALYHERLFHQFNDSLSTVNAQEAFAAERALQYTESENEKREKAELQAQLLAATNQQYRLAGLALLLLLVLGGGLLLQLNRTRLSLAQNNTKLNNLNATKDKFFGLIAHDLRGPVIALGSVGQQFDFHLKNDRPADARELAYSIESTAKGLSRLLDNLLNWALLQRGVIPYTPEIQSIQLQVKETVALFEETATLKQITIESSLSPDLKVFADARAVTTVLRNLISNAIKFSNTGSNITIRGQWTTGGIELAVADTGIGISPEQTTDIFAINSRSQPGTAGENGTGLGLSLCRELMELNRGTIRVESSIGAGSTFFVTFPSSN